MPRHVETNTNLTNSNLSISLQMSNNSNLTNQAQSYVEYVTEFETKNCDIDYNTAHEHKLQKSLDEMRVVMKQFNVLLNKMMDKNYELLAAKDQPNGGLQKEMQVLKKQIQNSKKLVANQESQIENLHNMEKELMGKGRDGYEQKLLDDIAEIKTFMPKVGLMSSHYANDINRNGYTLVNQETDSRMYLRVNILKGDIDRAYDRSKKLEEKDKIVQEKLREFEQKSYELSTKMDQALEMAKNNAIEVNSKGNVVSLNEKCNELKKKKESERKKNLLLSHVSQSNENNVNKKISDMKKLCTQYDAKHAELSHRLNQLQKMSEDILNKSNVIGELTQKSLPYMYAQTLLRGDRKKGENQLDGSRVSQSLLNGENKSYIKPSFKMRRPQRYGKSLSKQQINGKSRKKNAIIHFENQEKQYHGNNKSQNFQIRKKNNYSQEQKVKIWKKDLQEDNFFNEEHNKEENKLLKPRLNFRNKRGGKSEVPEEQGKKHFQLKMRGEEGQLSEQYMTYLEEKGKKILGI